MLTHQERGRAGGHARAKALTASERHAISKKAASKLWSTRPPRVDGMKTCSRCGDLKTLAAFDRDSRSRTSHASTCKDCKKPAQRAYRLAHMDEIRARQKTLRDSPEGKSYHVRYSKEYYKNPRNRMRLLARGAIKRAQRKGLAYDTALLTLLMANPPMRCACCNRDFDFSMYRGRNNRAASPSLDRFDPAGGYTVANVVVICMRCNEVKGDATADEIGAVLAYIKGAGLRLRGGAAAVSALRRSAKPKSVAIDRSTPQMAPAVTGG